MQHKKIVKSLMFCLVFYFPIYSMDLEEHQKSKIEKFFYDRIDQQTKNSYFPEEINNILFNHVLQDQRRWQLAHEYTCLGSINDISLFEESGKIAVASTSGCIYTFNSELQECKKNLLEKSPLLSLRLYNDKSRELLLCSNDAGKIFLRDETNAIPLITLQHGTLTNAIDLNIHTKKMVTGSDDNKACVWDCKGDNDTFVSPSQPPLILPHNGTVWKTVFSKDGTKTVTAALDGNARVFNENGQLECAVKHNNDFVCFVHITADNKKIISAGDDGVIKIVDITTGELLSQLEVPISSAIYTLCVSENDRFIAAGTSKGHVRVWDLARENTLLFDMTNEYFRKSKINFVGLDENATLVSVGKDEEMFSKKSNVYLKNKYTVCIYDIITGKMLYKINHAASVSHALLSKNGSLLISTSEDGRIKLSKEYTPDQNYLRRLLFLWALVKKNNAATWIGYLKDIAYYTCLTHQERQKLTQELQQLNVSKTPEEVLHNKEEYLHTIELHRTLYFTYLSNIWDSFDYSNQDKLWEQCKAILKSV